MSSKRTRCPPTCTGRPASSVTARVPSSPIRTVPALSPVRLSPCPPAICQPVAAALTSIVPCRCDCTDGGSLGPADIGAVLQAEAGERYVPALYLRPVELEPVHRLRGGDPALDLLPVRVVVQQEHLRRVGRLEDDALLGELQPGVHLADMKIQDHAGCGRVVAVGPVGAEREQPGHHLLGWYQPPEALVHQVHVGIPVLLNAKA